MSKETRGFFESLKETVVDSLKAAPAEIGAEMSRLATQGSAEIAGSLFAGNPAYVAYGAGQEAPEIKEQSPDVLAPAAEVSQNEPVTPQQTPQVPEPPQHEGPEL